MCVRYTLHKTDAAISAIGRALGHPLATPDWVEPRFNVTLTHVMPVVATGPGGPAVRALAWGLLPFHERGRPDPRLLPNAKAETAATLASFKRSIASRRCLVPANGFYEWETVGKSKRPHLFTLTDEEPFAFAGIWEPAQNGGPDTYAILTTEPNAPVARIHNRMPVILTPDSLPRWLGDEPLAGADYRELTRPLAAERMQERPVNRFVSNSRNEGPRCHEPPEEEPTGLLPGFPGDG